MKIINNVVCKDTNIREKLKSKKKNNGIKGRKYYKQVAVDTRVFYNFHAP